MSAIESSIFCVLNAEDTVVGVGFVVTARLAVTCAHVVEAVGSGPGQSVRLRFLKGNIERIAHVLVDPWSPTENDDIAFLELDISLETTTPVSLGTAQRCLNHRFNAYGFPNFPPYATRSAAGRLSEVIPVTTANRQPLLQLEGDEIAKGMSGAPVWDLDIGRVVGMVTEYKDDDRVRFAYAITSDTLNRLLPALLLRPPQLVEDYLAAIHEYCVNFPYLTLHDVLPPRSLEEVYVPLKVRPQPLPPDKQESDKGETLNVPQGGESLSVIEVMQERKYRHLLIMGEPGGGKSTLLRQLALRAWNAPNEIGLDAPCLPLLVPLRRLASGKGALTERLSRALAGELALAQSLPDDFFRTWPEQTGARWLVLLDALDEVPSNERARLMQWFSGLLTILGEHRLVITTRPAGFKLGELNEYVFGHYELLRFTSDQVGNFARKWFSERDKQFLSEFDRVRAGELRGTPLLLTVGAKVFAENGSLPEQRVTLYEQFVDIWLLEAGQQSLRVELGEQLFKVAKFILARLALAMTEDHNMLTEQSLCPVVSAYLRDMLDVQFDEAEIESAHFVRVMGRRSGVFIRRADNYQFLHPTFREYLAAFALERLYGQDMNNVWQRCIAHWADENWRQVSLFVLGMLKTNREKVNQWLLTIIDNDENGVYFAVDCIVEGVPIDDRLRGIIINRLLKIAHDMNVQAIKWKPNAISALGELGKDERVTLALVSLIYQPSVLQPIRYASIEVLRKYNQITELSRITSDPQLSTSIRSTANAALMSLGQRSHFTVAIPKVMLPGETTEIEEPVVSAPNLVDAGDEFNQYSQRELIARITNHQLSDTERQRGIVLLSESLRPQMSLLAVALEGDLAIELRLLAANLITQHHFSAEAMEAWISIAIDKTVSDYVRMDAAEMLIKLNNGNEAVSILQNLASTVSVNAIIRARAAEALWRLGHSKDARAMLLSLAYGEQISDVVRYRISEMLLGFGQNLHAYHILRSLAKDGNVNVYILDCVADSLRRSGHIDEAIQIWLKIALDTRIAATFRYTAAQSLHHFGHSQEAAEILMVLVLNPDIDEVVRRESALALERFGQIALAARAWFFLLSDNRIWLSTQREAIKKLEDLTLSSISSDDGNGTLLTIATNRQEDAALRERVANLLGKLGQIDAAKHAWLSLARDEILDGNLRENAAEELIKLDAVADASDFLWEITRDEKIKDTVRVKAVTALAGLQEVTDILTSFLALAKDENISGYIRSHIAEELGKLGKVEYASTILLMLARDGSIAEDLRRDAAERLGRLGQVEEASAILLALAHDDKVNWLTRNKIAQALTRLGRIDEAIQTWLSLACDESAGESIREDAVEELSRYDAPDNVVIQAWQALARDVNVTGSLRLHAARQLGDLGLVEDVFVTLNGLAHDNGEYSGLRIEAAEMLATCGRIDEAIQVWLSWARNQTIYWHDRKEIVDKLGGLGRIDELIALASDEQVDNDLRTYTAQAVANLGRIPEAIATLQALARNEKVRGDERKLVAEALAGLGQVDDAMRILLGLTTDETVEASVQASAAEALGSLGQIEVAARLLVGLARNGRVESLWRIRATEALRRLRRTTDLLALARDETMDEWLRWHAQEAAHGLGMHITRVDE